MLENAMFVHFFNCLLNYCLINYKSHSSLPKLTNIMNNIFWFILKIHFHPQPKALCFSSFVFLLILALYPAYTKCAGAFSEATAKVNQISRKNIIQISLAGPPINWHTHIIRPINLPVQYYDGVDYPNRQPRATDTWPGK